MWEGLVTCMRCQWRDRPPDGNHYLETGAKIGKAMLTYVDKPYPSWSLLVMAPLWHLTMWHLLLGNSGKPSLANNCDDKQQGLYSWVCIGHYILAPLSLLLLLHNNALGAKEVHFASMENEQDRFYYLFARKRKRLNNCLKCSFTLCIVSQ